MSTAMVSSELVSDLAVKILDTIEEKKKQLGLEINELEKQKTRWGNIKSKARPKILKMRQRLYYELPNFIDRLESIKALADNSAEIRLTEEDAALIFLSRSSVPEQFTRATYE